MRWALAAVATICLCGCAANRGRALDDDARQYVRLALAVGARDPDSLVGGYSGPARWRAEATAAYRGLDGIRRELVALGNRVHSRADPAADRVAFLAGQIDALIARIDVVRGARWPFGEEARRLFGVRLQMPPMPRRRSPAASPGASPASRGVVVAAVQVKAVFEQSLAICREETRRNVALPADESVTVEATRTESPWPAFTTYQGRHRSRIQINTAFQFTDRDLLELACHEGYPGHHTIYVWQDDALVRNGRLEFWVEPLFSPQAFLDEAAASYAPVLVPAAASDAATSAQFDEARLAIAWRYLDGEMEFARAAAALDTLAGTPGGPFLKFVNEYRTYVATYTAGRAIVARAVDGAPTVDARWTKYRDLVLRGRID